MIKFFRKIRQKLLSENKLSKYLIYAFGEIILVVIGILIALQINNWNIDYQLNKRETKYLIEIESNLLIDKENTQESIRYNNRKIAAIDTLMILISNAENSSDYMKFLTENLTLLITYPTFEPVRITFENMILSHSIDIIQNTELRTLLSTYYNYGWETSPQSASRIRTRKFADVLVAKIIDNPHYHKNMSQQLKSMLNSQNQLSWVQYIILQEQH